VALTRPSAEAAAAAPDGQAPEDDGLTSRDTSAMTTLATAYMRADRLGEAIATQRRVTCERLVARAAANLTVVTSEDIVRLAQAPPRQ
jgi:hypothetical protein